MKHLAPYLPYGLKIRWLQPEEHKNSFLKISDKDYNKEMSVVTMMAMVQGNECYKPILRPLSDLKNYISKLDFRAENEVQFTYYNSIPNQLTITATYKMMGDVFTDFIVNMNGFKNVDYWIVEKLFEWHFDVFGLIERGLAISIHDIKTK